MPRAAPSLYALNPAMPVLLRPDGAVQVGWDPRRAVAWWSVQPDEAGVSYRDPTDATNAGLSICHWLEKGDSFDAAIDSETAAGYSEHDAGFVVGAAVKTSARTCYPR
jgi:hypothetical protein